MNFEILKLTIRKIPLLFLFIMSLSRKKGKIEINYTMLYTGTGYHRVDTVDWL